MERVFFDAEWEERKEIAESGLEWDWGEGKFWDGNGEY
jgi:hypothetical protein